MAEVGDDLYLQAYDQIVSYITVRHLLGSCSYVQSAVYILKGCIIDERFIFFISCKPLFLKFIYGLVGYQPSQIFIESFIELSAFFALREGKSEICVSQ